MVQIMVQGAIIADTLREVVREVRDAVKADVVTETEVSDAMTTGVQTDQTDEVEETTGKAEITETTETTETTEVQDTLEIIRTGHITARLDSRARMMTMRIMPEELSQVVRRRASQVLPYLIKIKS